MSQSITITVSDEVYTYFQTMAEKAGLTLEEWIQLRIDAIVPRTAFMSTEERAAAIAELSKYAGAVDVGVSTGVDNDQIDRDLADEYASKHEDDQ